MHITHEQRLYRSQRDRLVAGVAGGLADYFGVDPTLVRLAWLLATIFALGPLALLIYLGCWLIVPNEPGLI
jgi:phage shock protein C